MKTDFRCYVTFDDKRNTLIPSYPLRSTHFMDSSRKITDNLRVMAFCLCHFPNIHITIDFDVILNISFFFFFFRHLFFLFSFQWLTFFASDVCESFETIKLKKILFSIRLSASLLLCFTYGRSKNEIVLCT